LVVRGWIVASSSDAMTVGGWKQRRLRSVMHTPFSYRQMEEH
jgi:hypothetical protein